MPMHSFRNMFVAGEHCDKETMEWTKKVFDCPVLDNWWQTGKQSVILTRLADRVNAKEV